MKNKKQIVLLSIAMLAAFITLVITFNYVFNESTKNMQEVSILTKEQLAINGSKASGTINVKGGHDSPSFYQNGSFYYETRTGINTNKVFCPSIGDIQLYCIQKGVSLQGNKELVADIKALDGVAGSVSSGSHQTPLPAKRYSNTYYVCVNNHSELVPSGAYIITAKNFIAPTAGSYVYGNSVSTFSQGEDITKEVRQVAIWLDMEVNEGETFAASGAKFTYLDMAQKLKDEAMEYKDYEAELKAHVDNPLEETSENTAKVNANPKQQYLIIGPYKMNYIEGNGSSAKFAGISNMQIKGYNDKKRNNFIKDIEIISYIQNGIEQELKFFNPTEEEGYVDRNENFYPSSGEEFYIKIKNPNQGYIDINQLVRYIDIDVEYSYMTTYAIKCELEGHQLVATPIRTGHNDSYSNNRLVSCTVNYRWKVTENPLPKQKMMDAWGERNLYKLNIRLTGNINNEISIPNRPSKPDEEPEPEPEEPIEITMNLGGYVWEDIKEGKESISNGIYAKLYNEEQTQNENDFVDRVLPNVKVTLYECEVDENGNVMYEDGKIVSRKADLLSNADKQELTEQEILNRVNPQITDENGYYQFDGLNVFNKYYVIFEYNGQTYMPTEYLVTDKEGEKLIHQNSALDMVINAKLYNTKIWEATSKGTEKQEDNQVIVEDVVKTRQEYNQKFGEIGSSPKNYKSSNSLQTNILLREGNNYYNETFNINDLMGFVLTEEGNYVQDEVQLIDEFYEINNDGNIIEVKEIKQGEISKKIQEYISKNYAYPEEQELINIYEEIVNEYGKNEKQKEKLWKKLQYIEDCKINAYTGSPYENGEIDLYPVYDDFVVDDESMVIPGVGTKPAIYNGQYYVNLGLWRRAKNNMSLKKDLYKAATKINGKTEVYSYDKRNEDDYWTIQLRMRDYYNYYGTNYNRELYASDYNYNNEATNLYGQELELYVTYKIIVRNSSQNVLNEITEVVDYYDKDYTYLPNLSWVMYKDNAEDDNKKVAVPQNSYYNMIEKQDLSQIENARNVNSSYGVGTSQNGTYAGDSIYGENSKQDLEQEYNSVYIRGLSNKKLQSGETAYIYLTFKVNTDSNGQIILDDDNSQKQNYAEINGYKNYYMDGTKLPNDVVIEGNDVPAGIRDSNSTPGNLELEDLIGEKYEKNFEDDTDRAKGLKVLLDERAIRGVNGTVWEDERTYKVQNAIIGDGLKQDDEIGVNGVEVELVEKLENGNEFVWQTTNSGSGKGSKIDLKTGEIQEYTYDVKNNGYYEFASFIPGNYIVKFKYGNNKQTVLTAPNGGENSVSYNGQDFKSTVYAKDLKNEKTLSSYEDEFYNIEEADKLSLNEKTNLSDAKDLWDYQTITVGRRQNGQTTYNAENYLGRTNVNDYSATGANNHVAEVLASPYSGAIDEGLIQELMQNTNMTAQTGVIVTEVEYNRTQSDGNNSQSNGADKYLYDNDKNSNYTINNVDFGLTERPKAALELNKKVTNVKIDLANGNNLFDATKSVDNLIWLQGKNYNLDSKIKNNKYEEYYDESKTDNNYHRYSYRTEVDKLVNGLYPSGKNGIIQATMDEEIMHGATIQISYKLTVKNVGETDYAGQEFYYEGKGASEENKVTTTANEVIDYVANNLQYREQINNDWQVVSAEELTNNDENKVKDRLVNNSLEEQIKQYNTIIKTSKLGTNLKPGEEVEKDLILTQLITSQNTQDDKTYDNIAEIVQTSNTVGRRMAYSIVGNQNPLESPAEIDSSKAEEVVILPPFGHNYLIYIGVATVAILILTAGIILIKKRFKNIA